MTDTKKQTAVEWLVDELTALGFIDAWSDEILKARLRDGLAMEREQIEDAYCNGVIDGAGEILNRDSIKPDAVKYYDAMTCNHEWVMTDQPWKRCAHCGAIRPTGKEAQP